MNESLKDALTRTADELGPADPDLPAIERRGRRRRARRYGVTALVAVAATAAIALPLYGLSGIGSHPVPGGTAGERVSENVLLAKTPGVRCTASMPAVVEPGAQLGLTMTLENVTDATVKATTPPPAFPVEVQAGDGTTWDTADLMNHSWPGELPTPLAPGESKTVQLQPLAVQFPGPLTVTPTCAGERMPALDADVANPGSTPRPEDAVTRAVAATAGLFNGCTPTPAASTVGTVSPPDDPMRSLEVRCAAQVRSEPGFAIVTLVMSTPSSAESPKVPGGLLLSVDLASDTGNAETLAWRFVVTPTGVLPVASATHTRTEAADAMDTAYELSSKGWGDGGQSRCGGDEYSAGGDGSSVLIVIYEACG